jgi:hypothetical protein
MSHKRAQELREFLIDADGKLRKDNWEVFEEKTNEGKLKISDIQGGLPALADRFNYKPGSRNLTESLQLREAGGIPVDTTTFPQMVGQLFFSEIREQHDLEANVFYPRFRKVMSSLKGTEIVPSVTHIDPDALEAVAEGEAYPVVGMLEEYFTLPAKTKHGGIVKITAEALTYVQQSQMVVEKARQIGQSLGALRENQCIDVFIGQTNNYNRNGSAANTYTTSGVVNNQTGVALTDWTDIDTAMRLVEDVLDPNTSEPLAWLPKQLVVMPAKVATAGRILAAIQSRSAENASAGTISETTLGAGSPLKHLGLDLELLTSRRLYRRVLAGPEPTASIARDGWFLTDLDKAFAYYEVWPLRLDQQGADSPEAFSHDVALQFKASFLGVPVSREKRCTFRLENTGW